MATARIDPATSQQLNMQGVRDPEMHRLELQVKALRKALDATRQELQLLTYERDELVQALRNWAGQRA
jgi:hypothetical protein